MRSRWQCWVLLVFASTLCAPARASSPDPAALVAQAQQALAVTLGARVEEGSQPRPVAAREADDKLIGLRRELLRTGPAAVRPLLADPPRSERQWEVRDWQLETIRRMGAAAPPELKAALTDPSTGVRASARLLLWGLRTPEEGKAALAALMPANAHLRDDLPTRPLYLPKALLDDPRGLELVLALLPRQLRPPDADAPPPDVPHLISLASDLLAEWMAREGSDSDQLEDGHAVRDALIGQLRLLRDPRIVPALLPVFERPHSVAEPAAQQAVYELPPFAADAVLPLLDHPAAAAQEAALRYFARVPAPETAAPRLAALLKASDEEGSSWARQAVLRMRPEVASGILLRYLHSAPKDVAGAAVLPRASAVQALAYTGTAEASDAVFAVLLDRGESFRVRASALAALTEVGTPGVGDALARELRDPRQAGLLSEIRAADLRLAMADPVPLLLAILESDAPPDARASAAWRLCQFPDRRAVGPLTQVARTSRGALRNGAVTALGDSGDPAAVPVLLGMLEANPQDQRVITALGKLRDSRARAPLRRLLARAEPGSSQEGYLAVALGRLGDAEVIPILREWMKSDSHGDGFGPDAPGYFYTAEAVEALAGIGPAAVPTLLDALDWRYEHTADYAALALGRMRERRAVPSLIALLHTPWERTRHHAAQALGGIGDASAVPALREVLADEIGYVRVAAAEALWQLGDGSHLPVIIDVLLGERKVWEYDWEREEAARALARIGTPEAMGALHEAQSNSDYLIRRAGARALRTAGR